MAAGRHVQFPGTVADHYRMQWNRADHFLHEALELCLRQGFLYRALVTLLAFCTIIILHHILKLYLTKAKMLGVTLQEKVRIKKELQEAQEKQKSGRLRY